MTDGPPALDDQGYAASIPETVFESYHIVKFNLPADLSLNTTAKGGVEPNCCRHVQLDPAKGVQRFVTATPNAQVLCIAASVVFV